jgi:hypothetical protein
MNLIKYSNGTGHLIMSVLLSIIGATLICLPWLSLGMHGIGTGILVTVVGAWFSTSGAKAVVKEVLDNPNVQSGASEENKTNSQALKDKAGL